MTKASVKVVRPWPAEQPRPPVAHRTESMKAAPVNSADRPVKTKAAQAP